MIVHSPKLFITIAMQIMRYCVCHNAPRDANDYLVTLSMATYTESVTNSEYNYIPALNIGIMIIYTHALCGSI